MNLNNPVDQNASHSFINALLEFHVFDFRLIVHLSSHVMIHNASCVLTYTLWVCGLVQVTFLYCSLHVLIHSLHEVLINLIQLFLE